MATSTHVYRTELTPVDFLKRNAAVLPEKLAVVHGARRYSYRQFEARANRLASALRRSGLRKLDRVAFLCPNIPAMLEAHQGVPALGAFSCRSRLRVLICDGHRGVLSLSICWRERLSY